MNRKKLEDIEREMESLRRGQAKARDLENIANRLSRLSSNKRGKEPTYINAMFTDLRPLSIPHHGGRDIPPGTKNSILNQLGDDLIRWIEWLEAQKMN